SARRSCSSVWTARPWAKRARLDCATAVVRCPPEAPSSTRSRTESESVRSRSSKRMATPSPSRPAGAPRPGRGGHVARAPVARYARGPEETMRAVVTAGGTYEPIDDVRVVTNLSTGGTGLAVARALLERGVDVTLLAGPQIDPRDLPPGARVVRFRSTADLEAA